MFDGYIRVAAITPKIRTADCEYNARQIIDLIKAADKENIRLICLPELCITGYTCNDLFFQDTLQKSAADALNKIVSECADCDVIAIAGLPLTHMGKLFNVAVVFCRGKILGVVPKSHIPNYAEFYELRHFTPAPPENSSIQIDGKNIPFGTKLIFQCENLPAFALAVEICEDLWTPCPPSANHALAGATIIANLSASSETTGKAAYRRALVSGQSARLLCGYIYTDAGYGESTTDIVFSAHNLICENGLVLAESPPFGDGKAVSEIDLQAIAHDRKRMNTFPSQDGYCVVPFSLETHCDSLYRHIDLTPFIPKHDKPTRYEEILNIQTHGLVKRLDHTNCRAVLGVSGGLDSCLALIIAARACEILNRQPDDILAVTMPCFGTTERTKNNALELCAALGVHCREIDISDSVRQHLKDIGHTGNPDTVYENAQARTRTMVLMDLANQHNGIVIGSGDLSELALGWATYNGDHISMYGVNAGVPKTLVRHIIEYVAQTCGNPTLEAVLTDIAATPVSPELLPPTEGEISQCTEEIVGPYELHDFFLYHILRWGRNPQTVYKLACAAAAEKYPPAEIMKWLKVFYTRFFSQQFKRNCLPDGPKIGSITLSPRGDWRMPSDAVCKAWLEELQCTN